MRALFTILALTLALSVAPARAESLRNELAAQFEVALTSARAEAEQDALAQLEAFYRGRAMAPLWVGETGLRPRGEEIARLLGLAGADALDPRDYGVPAIEALIGAPVSARAPERLAELELRLSLGLVTFAADLGQGRVAPHISDPDLFVFREEVDKAAVIAAAAQAEDLPGLLQRYRPQTPRYERLKAALVRYRALAAQGGWAPIAEGPVLKPGMTDPRVPALRRRLALWGDLEIASAAADPELYGADLVRAVARMQWRHGLEPDGVVGRKTLAAFNVPLEQRIRQMTINLERRRWMPDDLGERFIFVNLADFVLKVVEKEKTILDMRVVVGKPFHMTPVFSHEMTYVVMNPYWNVPPSIASKELLPKIKQNVSYLAENNFELFTDWSSGAGKLDPQGVDWARVNGSSFPYKLRQGPGDGNALGRMKFMFPNRFNVYLHDTPAKALFKKDQRSFSHGCIRVHHPELLGAVVLAKTEGWPLSRIEETIAGGERRVVTLAAPLPVHISYLTAWVNKDGSLHFRDDIYGRDKKLADALLGAS